MKHLRTVFLIVLCALMLFPTACKINVSQTPRAGAIPEEQTAAVDTTSNETLDAGATTEKRQAWVEAILNEPADEQGNWLVYITREPFTEQEINNAFVKHYGYSPEPYGDDARCRAEIIPDIEAEVIEEYGAENAYSAEFGEELYGYPISPIKKAIQESAEQFRKQRNNLISSLYTQNCNQFLSAYKIPMENVVYLGIFTGSVIVEINEEKIREIANDKSVLEMSIWIDGEVECGVSISTDQINADSAFDNNSN